MIKLKIRSGDNVVVIAGKDKGKTGRVLKVIPKLLKVFVSGVNLVKRHTKPTATNDGGIILKESSLHISNVAHIDPISNKPTKVLIRNDNGVKSRIAKKSGQIINHTISPKEV